MKKTKVIHPFLFAAFPILSLFSANADTVAPSDVWSSILLAVSGAAILWFMLWPILRDSFKRGLAVSLAVFLCFSYGPAMDGLRWILGQSRLLRDVSSFWLLCAGMAALATGLLPLMRTRRSLDGITRFLNKFSLIVVLIALCSALVEVGRYQYYTLHTHTAPTSASTTPVRDPSSPAPPNIYYITLDAYARADILKDIFHYDNTSFVTALRQRGFFVANKSHSNYMYTNLSLSSSLNLDYLSPNDDSLKGNTAFRIQILNQTRTNKVSTFLKERGYKYIAFDTGSESLRQTNADVVEKPAIILSEFQNLLITKTPLRTFLSRMPNPWQYFVHRNVILHALDRLSELATLGSPLFVFALVPAPHAPFVLDANGDAVYPKIPFSMLDGHSLIGYGMTPEDYIAGYTAQLAYVSKRVLQIVDRIQAATPNSVIIIQGDHGSRMGLTDDPATTNLHEVFSNLSAVYLPDRDADALFYDDMSNVNAFRILFNAYFGTHYERLPDRSFFSPWSLNAMVDVTDKTKR